MRPILLHLWVVLLRLAAAAGLRCNTYSATADSHSGTGIETCVPGVNMCIMRSAPVFGVRTYTMSCDDAGQCYGVPPGACCTKPEALTRNLMQVKCSSTNFAADTVSADSFPVACEQRCPRAPTPTTPPPTPTTPTPSEGYMGGGNSDLGLGLGLGLGLPLAGAAVWMWRSSARRGRQGQHQHQARSQPLLE